MAFPVWLLVAIAAHTVLVVAAAVAVCRVIGYAKYQRMWQILLALAVPLLGAIAVIAMAKHALADPPHPSASSFEPQSYNAD